MTNAITIPGPGALVTFEQMEAAERQIADHLGEMDDIASITDTRDRIAALEQYLRGKQMHLPALGAQRRLEARIGQLLGKAQVGGDRMQVHREEPAVTHKAERSDFRLLAHGLNGTPITDDEWRQSRRALVALIKERTRKEEQVDVIEPIEPDARRNNQINLPTGVTAEELARRGMAYEKNGGSAMDFARSVNVHQNTYRRIRDIVTLSDRDDLSERDSGIVRRALDTMNAHSVVSGPWQDVEPIADRIWQMSVGASRGQSRENVEKLRNEKFENAFSTFIYACECSAEMDVPYLSEERCRSAIKDLDKAAQHIAALKRRISEVRG